MNISAPKRKPFGYCGAWEAIGGASEIPQQEIPVIRGEDREVPRGSPWSSYPIGRIVECVYARDPGLVFRNEGYFAHMANGDVFY